MTHEIYDPAPFTVLDADTTVTVRVEHDGGTFGKHQAVEVLTLFHAGAVAKVIFDTARAWTVPVWQLSVTVTTPRHARKLALFAARIRSWVRGGTRHDVAFLNVRKPEEI